MNIVVGTVWILLGCACMAGCGHLVWEGKYEGLILFWPGAILGQFGICHIWCPQIGVMMLGKSSNGFIPLYRTVIFLPYLLCAWLWWLIRYAVLLCKNEPAYDKVWDNVYVGRHPVFSGFPENTGLVIDLTTEMYGIKPKDNPGCRYMVAPALDTCSPDPEAWHSVIKEIIDTKLTMPSTIIYVHCAYGHGRSGITVAAAMVRTGVCANFEIAAGHLKGERPSINWQPVQEFAALQLIDPLTTTELSDIMLPPEAG